MEKSRIAEVSTSQSQRQDLDLISSGEHQLDAEVEEDGAMSGCISYELHASGINPEEVLRTQKELYDVFSALVGPQLHRNVVLPLPLDCLDDSDDEGQGPQNVTDSTAAINGSASGGAAGWNAPARVLQLQIALAMSKEKADQEEKRRRSDDLRLQMALSQSENEFKHTGVDVQASRLPPKKENASALLDLLDVDLGGRGGATALSPTNNGDPWAPASASSGAAGWNAPARGAAAAARKSYAASLEMYGASREKFINKIAHEIQRKRNAFREERKLPVKSFTLAEMIEEMENQNGCKEGESLASQLKQLQIMFEGLGITPIPIIKEFGATYSVEPFPPEET